MLGSVKTNTDRKLAVVVHLCNSSTCNAEAGGLGIDGLGSKSRSRIVFKREMFAHLVYYFPSIHRASNSSSM